MQTLTLACPVDQLHNQLVAIVSSADMQDWFAARGAEPVASTRAQLASHLNSKSAKWARVVKVSGVRAD